MTNVAEELTSPNDGLTKEYVAERVQDWKRRVSGLYQKVSDWLPDGTTTDMRSSVHMHEDLMKRFGVPATTLPVLTFLHGQTWVGKLVPQGLWIIGANGRVDMFSANGGQAIIVDRSENFAAPNWLIAPANDRRKTIPLDERSFGEALGV